MTSSAGGTGSTRDVTELKAKPHMGPALVRRKPVIRISEVPMLSIDTRCLLIFAGKIKPYTSYDLAEPREK